VCLAEEPGEVRIGAVLTPTVVARRTGLLRSSGYGALDEKALQEIQRHRFDAADGIRAYILTVDTSVNYGPQPCLTPTQRLRRLGLPAPDRDRSEFRSRFR
jgi:hypothetical protein